MVLFAVVSGSRDVRGGVPVAASSTVRETFGLSAIVVDMNLTKQTCNLIEETYMAGEIKALLFDVFGTVVDWRNIVAREARSFLERHTSDIDAFVFADAWRALYAPAMEEVRSGRRQFVRLDILHRENLDRVLSSLLASE